MEAVAVGAEGGPAAWLPGWRLAAACIQLTLPLLRSETGCLGDGNGICRVGAGCTIAAVGHRHISDSETGTPHCHCNQPSVHVLQCLQ